MSNLFLPLEQQCILSISLSNRVIEDSAFWTLERDGKYSVRSTYRPVFKDERMEASSLNSLSRTLWNNIWNSSMFPRVKLFVWRVVSKAFPTKLGLSNRIPSIDSKCVVCGLMRSLCSMSLRIAQWHDVYGKRVVWRGSLREGSLRWWISGIG